MCCFFYHGFLTILKQSWRNTCVIMVSRLKNIRYNFPEYQLHTYHYYLAFAFCHKQKSLHSRIKRPHFRSRATNFFFGYHQMWNATKTTSYKRINEFGLIQHKICFIYSWLRCFKVIFRATYFKQGSVLLS